MTQSMAANNVVLTSPRMLAGLEVYGLSDLFVLLSVGTPEQFPCNDSDRRLERECSICWTMGKTNLHPWDDVQSV